MIEQNLFIIPGGIRLSDAYLAELQSNLIRNTVVVIAEPGAAIPNFVPSNIVFELESYEVTDSFREEFLSERDFNQKTASGLSLIKAVGMDRFKLFYDGREYPGLTVLKAASFDAVYAPISLFHSFVYKVLDSCTYSILTFIQCTSITDRMSMESLKHIGAERVIVDELDYEVISNFGFDFLVEKSLFPCRSKIKIYSKKEAEQSAGTFNLGILFSSLVEHEIRGILSTNPDAVIFSPDSKLVKKTIWTNNIFSPSFVNACKKLVVYEHVSEIENEFVGEIIHA